MDEHTEDDDGSPLLGRAETAAAALFALLLGIGSLMLLPPAAALATAVLALLMALITLTDLRHFLIPDVLSLPAIPLGVAANIAVFHAGDWRAGLTASLLGAALAGGAFYLLRTGYARLRGVEGLGLGDVKLAAVAGAWLEPALLAPACLVAALAGLCAVAVAAVMPGRRLASDDQIPFGSFIAPTILLFWLWRTLAPGMF